MSTEATDAQARLGSVEFVRFSRRCVDGRWRKSQMKIEQFSRPIKGGGDAGCAHTPVVVARACDLGGNR